MKRTDLEKLRGLKINNRLKGTPPPSRFAAASAGDKAGARLNPLVAKLLGQQAKEEEPTRQGDADH
ncbi:hypothetical protein [Pseudothauera lacus]|uniref:Uncharacterized protein n=1 Tax=Pseudothauera lacus TaxID=2136175 RepID=A0A2T4IB51_9RHOO|nr:hypothetical protein [Pseudothauera lacus]PTD95014.1 hypothetical protein C8261_16600 [Pseudothauera lacus]